MARPVSYNNRGQETNLDSGIPQDPPRLGFAAARTGRGYNDYPSGATLTTSWAVVMPMAIFIAPETRKGFMPSLYASSRILASSGAALINLRNAGVSAMIS